MIHKKTSKSAFVADLLVKIMKYLYGRDVEPWFPVMGEFHYSRYPKALWRDALLRISAGGVTVVSSYVIWIHHEETEGEYDFDGNKSLRDFVRLCREVGVYMFLRIGPWCHGEVRNGGFPDWLLKKPYSVRTNDSGYLEAVRSFYEKIYSQVSGEFFCDGGSIIGVQIENEYGHCGGLNGDEGERHMRQLSDMAREIGFDAPLYTATGWGGAITGGLIPVMGGYCEAPWDQRLTDIEPSGNYIFTYERNDHNIGSDYGLGTGITFDISKFPYLTAELGGGLQVTHHRRPVARAADIGAMSLVKLGSGVNLLGYYMYHGGTNPKGKYTTLQESKAAGDINDLPEYSYDFNAPLKEYGQAGGSFGELRLLTLFLEDFGSELCGMPAYIPSENPLKPDNFSDLRYSFRHNGKSGYLFVNNFQRRYEMSEHENVCLSLRLDGETIAFPSFDVKNGDYFFCPFNMRIGGATLKSTLSTPLCRVGEYFFFYSDRACEYIIEGEIGENKIVTLSRDDAKNAYKLKCRDRERLIVVNGIVTENEKTELFSGRKLEITVYPPFENTPDGFERAFVGNDCAGYRRIISEAEASAVFREASRDDEKITYEIEITVPDGADDCILGVSYDGDMARLYINGEPESDSFYTGEPWEIGLKRFGFPEKITVELYPLYKDAEVFLEKRPNFVNGRACRLCGISAEAKFKTALEGIK